MKKFTIIFSDSLEKANEKADQLIQGRFASWHGLISMHNGVKLVGSVAFDNISIINSFAIQNKSHLNEAISMFRTCNSIIIDEKQKEPLEQELKEVIFLMNIKHEHLLNKELNIECHYVK